METLLGRFRNLIVLTAILFAQIIGLAVQVKRPAQQGDTRLIRLWAVAGITPFEKAVVHTQNFFSNTWHNYLYLRGVRRENRELRAELEQMKLEQVRLKEDAEMARRIQSLLGFKEQYINTTVAAQVIGTSGSDQSRVLYIDKGSKDGLRQDMAVITPNGIVGKLVQVFPETAQVLPINDQLSGVGVTLKNSRLQGILRGAADGTTTVQYIMADERIAPGEEVITSGGDRIFPRGLPVGKVVEVQPGKDLFLNIRVAPAAQLNRVEEVLVITRMVEKAPDVQDLGPIRASDILAQRLPTVPDKTPVDVNGNAIAPPNGPGSPATGSAAANKPGTGATAGSPGNRPPATAGGLTPNTGTSTAVTRAPGSTAAGATANKPAAAVGTTTTSRPTGTVGSAGAAPGGTGVGNRSATTAPKPAAGNATANPAAVGTNGGTVKKPATNAAEGVTADKPASGDDATAAPPKPARRPATDTAPPPANTTRPTPPPAENPPQ